MNYDCHKIIFPENAYQQIIRESYKRSNTETGGILLGHINENGIWFVIEVVEPGDESIFTTHYFEYDTEYVNKKANQISDTYKIPLNVLGLWHRHPGSLDVFSSTDDATNKSFAELNKKGAISGLVNLDPEFRLTMYHVNQQINYLRRAYIIDSSKIPREFLERANNKHVESEPIGANSEKRGFLWNFIGNLASKNKVTNDTVENNTLIQNTEKIQKNITVLYPEELLTENFTGSVYGFFIKKTGTFNIISIDDKDGLEKIGTIIESDRDENLPSENHLLNGILKEDKYIFYYKNEVVNSESYSLINDIFSRNSGILDSSFLLSKGAIISGCGSVGSLVALELARAGVGSFLLIDNDILSHQNICRHQCGLYDVGKIKVEAVREKILQFNPAAKVEIQNKIIERVPKSVFDNCSDRDIIIVGCADSREADLYANRIAKIYKHSFISIGFWERAFAGEIFYSIDDISPCYQCYYDNIRTEGDDQMVSSNNNLYTHEEDLKKVNFQPGRSSLKFCVKTKSVRLPV